MRGKINVDEIFAIPEEGDCRWHGHCLPAETGHHACSHEFLTSRQIHAAHGRLNGCFMTQRLPGLLEAAMNVGLHPGNQQTILPRVHREARQSIENTTATAGAIKVLVQ